MENVNLVISIVFLAVSVIVILWMLIRKKSVKLTSVDVGPFSVEITKKETPVDKIEIIDMPIAGCSGEVLSPPLRIDLQDINGCPVKGKIARIEFFDEGRLLSSKNYQGKTSGVSDGYGIIAFNDLILKKTGRVCISILVDSLEAKTEDIDIFPPGLNLDFWNEPIGTPVYEEKFDRALRMSGNNSE